jgi:2-keto-4-pentenoate hydratase/2-oxohepta-3-ene-1,7-dioic acid hydratase in catechol pathway
MRLCRFHLDDLTLAGFFYDDHLIPIDQAAEAYCEGFGVELLPPTTGDLRELLPPDGNAFPALCKLAEWVEDLDFIQRAELAVTIDEVELLVPVATPGKLLLLAGNYAAHIAEVGGGVHEASERFPYVFMKPASTTLTHPGDPVILPRSSPDHIDWECELGVVIGRRCRAVRQREALDYVAGYTVVDDITDRKFVPNPKGTLGRRDAFFDWLHGKWHDTFCPVGPCILTADSIDDPQALELELTVNGDLKQSGSTADMIFSVAAIVSFLSQFVTLEPGDLISTGTTAGVGAATGTYLKPGDLIRATISQIGTLENPVISDDED